VDGIVARPLQALLEDVVFPVVLQALEQDEPVTEVQAVRLGEPARGVQPDAVVTGASRERLGVPVESIPSPSPRRSVRT
jgi:hypothetical protein